MNKLRKELRNTLQKKFFDGENYEQKWIIRCIGEDSLNWNNS